MQSNIIESKGMFVVYGNVGCSQCDTTKKLLNEKDLPFIYKLFGKDYEIGELMELLPTPSRSMPQIFKIGEGNKLEYIGGLPNLIQTLKQ